MWNAHDVRIFALRPEPRRQLEDSLWEFDRDSGSNVIEVYVARLRRKLSPGGERRAIETIRGGGYRLIAQDGG